MRIKRRTNENGINRIFNSYSSYARRIVILPVVVVAVSPSPLFLNISTRFYAGKNRPYGFLKKKKILFPIPLKTKTKTAAAAAAAATTDGVLDVRRS